MSSYKLTFEQIAEAENVWNESLKPNPFPSSELDDIHTLHAYMETFQIPAKAITRLLLETDAVIAGSLPLQAVLHKQWDDGDIDIYLQENMTNKMTQWHGLLTAFGYALFPGRGQSYITGRNPRLREAINEVCTYMILSVEEKPRKIQIISCKNVPYVLNAVDLSCTTVRYDGTRLVALEDIALIRAKIAYIRFPMHHLTAHEATMRILKYTTRGFTILNYERKSPYTGWDIDALIHAYSDALAAVETSD